MTIRDMCRAGIDIHGRVQVICWILDEYKKVFFDDYADHIGDQEWLDMEIKYMYPSEDGAMVFELELKTLLHILKCIKTAYVRLRNG